ncbi:MAG: PKD domain-containing protein [Bacteroidota bacterium]
MNQTQTTTKATTFFRLVLPLIMLWGTASCVCAQDNVPHIEFRTDALSGKITFKLVGIELPDRASLLWDFGDGEVAESSTASHRYRFPGHYKVRVFIWSENRVGQHFTQKIETSALTATAESASR